MNEMEDLRDEIDALSNSIQVESIILKEPIKDKIQKGIQNDPEC